MCNKLKIDKIKALFIVANSKKSLNFNRRENRIYYCIECKSWHTTSQKAE